MRSTRLAGILLVLGASLAVADTTVPPATTVPPESPRPRVVHGTAPCKSVDDCWLDAAGRPIARPRRFRGKPIPRGDCGARLQWLRNILACDAGVCTATFVGDRC